MRVGPIVMKIRDANTLFGNVVGGAAELEMVRTSNAIKKDMAFVIPIEETAADNTQENSIDQKIIEKFAVVVVLSNNETKTDKFGVIAYDKLHGIRSQLFRALIGHEIFGAESKISYSGGQLLPLNPAYLWYQFDFQYQIRLIEFDGYADLEGTQFDNDGEFRDKIQESQLHDLTKIYSQYIISPDENIPYEGELPASAAIVDMSTVVDIGDDKNPGAFARGFAGGYDFYRILNRRNDPK